MSGHPGAAPSDADDSRDSAIVDFLARYRDDVEQGREVPLSKYLALYPGQEPAIAREYVALMERAEHPAEQQVREGARGEGGFGPYRLIRELGRGGQGEVWLARDERLDRTVALKVVPCAPGFEIAPRLRREAQVTSQLEHDGICPVFDIGSDGSHAWIAMRFVEGRTLAEEIDAHREAGRSPQPARVLAMIERVARAAHVAHESGVIHRDLKPANIMVTTDGNPVVLDFGIARETEGGPALTLTGDALGTPPYMAPEQLAPNPTAAGRALDRSVDIWALGVTLYEALTLERPFGAPTLQQLVRAIASQEPSDPRKQNPDVPKDAVVVLATALAKEPSARYRTALELAEDLRRVREHEPIFARPASPLLKVRRWSRRNPALAASLAALMLVLAIGLGVSSSLLGETRRSLEETRLAYDKVTRLSDLKVASDLLSEERALWPTRPALEVELQGWLDRLQQLEDRLDLHRAARTELEARVGATSAPSTDATTDAWMLEQIQQLFEHVQGLRERRDGVARRRDFAHDVGRLTIDERAEEWQRCASAVAAGDLYSGLQLLPQLGLIPLGADPESGLQEFAHLESGEPALRDPASGRLDVHADTGLVLVLVPGGTATLGALPPSPDRPRGTPHVDPFLPENRILESPTEQVRLDPFFLSKYEMTQAQWTRHTGENPSGWQGARADQYASSELAPVSPVDNVSWTACERIVRELGLSLPTDAQWEYAARAGSTTVWPCGDDERSLVGHANLADSYARRNGGNPQWEFVDWLEDGFVIPAPVGSYRPNAFGLHDTLGNVQEWCLDPVVGVGSEPRREGDGAILSMDDVFHSVRGGSFATSTREVRSAARGAYNAQTQALDFGLRPARALDR